MLVANTSSENLEMIEGVLASTMAEFLAVRSAGNTPEPAGTAEPAGPDAVGPQYSAVQETTSSGQEALQLHDTGALEDALERAEKRRVELAAKGMSEESDLLKSERVQARVAEVLAKQSAAKSSGESDNKPENMQITPLNVRRSHLKSMEAESTFLQIARHMDPAVGKETLERAALQVKISDTRVVAAKFVVNETEARLRLAAAAGIKTIVKAMEQHQINPDVQLAGCKALTDLAAKLKGQKEGESATIGIRAAIQALRCLASNAQVQEAACIALYHLAPLIEVTTVLGEGSEAVTAVISEYTSNAAVLTHACRALISILGDHSDTHARTRCIEANGLQALAKALKGQPRFGPLHEAAMELLTLLVQTDADRDSCWSLGAAQLAAVSIANHPSLPAVVEHGCGVLERLCNTPQRAEQACALEAVAIILTAVRMHRAEAKVQIAGATCLKAMIVTANGKQKAAQAGAMEAIAVAVFGHAEDVKMQEAGARLIKSLAVVESVRSRPTAVAAIEGLCASVCKFRDNRTVAAEGCGALCNLCIDQPANRQKLAECGAAEAAVAVMTDHIFAVDVQEAACAVLWVLGAEPGGDVIAQGGPAAIVTAMRRFPQEASLQTVGCAAFKAISEQPDAEAALRECGALEAVMEAVRAHGTNATVQQNGMEAIAAIARLSAAMQRAALDEGAVDLCRSAMTLRFSSDVGVTAACEKVLDVLEGAVWITASTPTKSQQQAAPPAAPPAITAK